MWWNECFVHQPPSSTQIDGACNWWPFCVTAKINRHCCGQGRSMSHTKQAREWEEFMDHHIHQQHIVTISADFAAVTHSCSYLITFNNSVYLSFFCIKLCNVLIPMASYLPSRHGLLTDKHRKSLCNYKLQ